MIYTLLQTYSDRLLFYSNSIDSIESWFDTFVKQKLKTKLKKNKTKFQAGGDLSEPQGNE